jgi:hypothetical protein
LTIEGKWLEAIVHMTKFEILNLAHPKQVQPLVSIHVCCKFQLSRTSFVGFQKDVQQFIPKIERNLSVEMLIAHFAISCNDNV